MSFDVQDCGEHTGDLEIDADVVVVGSGAGGAVTAAILAEAGQRVVILEEGRRVTADEHAAMRPSESLRHLWRDGGMTVAVGLGDTPAINISLGRVIGGSSMITGGVCFRTPEVVLREWSEELGLRELTGAKMEPYFESVEAGMSVEEVPVAMRSRSTALFGEGLQKRGLALKSMHRNTRGCRGCGQCNFGCPHQAKLSVDLTYLPRAVKAGAEIFSRCRVDRVLTAGDRAVGVAGRLLNGPGGRAGNHLTVWARRVVMAAGAPHTPLILSKSGVGRRGKHVGRNMTVHPAFRVLAEFDEPVRGWQGALQSAYNDTYADERITFMSLFIPPGVLAAIMPGVGPAHHEVAHKLTHLALIGVLIHDHGGGRVHSGLGREPVLTYRMDPEDRAAVPVGLRRAAEIFFDAGATRVTLPILGHGSVDADGLKNVDIEGVHGRNLECASQHPLGSCRMGIHKDQSVVDPAGETWDLRELFIADGSIVPSSLGVNPQVTIMSMATRIAWMLREKPLPA